MYKRPIIYIINEIFGFRCSIVQVTKQSHEKANDCLIIHSKRDCGHVCWLSNKAKCDVFPHMNIFPVASSSPPFSLIPLPSKPLQKPPMCLCDSISKYYQMYKHELLIFQAINLNDKKRSIFPPRDYLILEIPLQSPLDLKNKEKIWKYQYLTNIRDNVA